MESLSMYERQLQILGYVALAMLLGAVHGFGREMAHKPAGLRTHRLVTGAAALLMGLGDVILDRFDIHLKPCRHAIRSLAHCGGRAYHGCFPLIRH